MSDNERLNTFLSEQEYMTLAVTLPNGAPWATPVRIKTQFAGGFEWDSMENTEHSKAISQNPTIAISMWSKDDGNGGLFGFYAKATAKKMTEGGDKPARYQAVVVKAWINDQTFNKREVSLEP